MNAEIRKTEIKRKINKQDIFYGERYIPANGLFVS